MKEEWREVPGFPGYFVSDQGRVRGRRGWVLKVSTNKRGYKYVSLWTPDVQTCRTVHRLVLETFVGPRPAGQLCRHLNGVPDDNRLPNLRWGTHQENADDKVSHGTQSRHHGGRAKLSPEQVAEIRATDTTVYGSQTALARKFGVTQMTIANAATGRLYRNA